MVPGDASQMKLGGGREYMDTNEHKKLYFPAILLVLGIALLGGCGQYKCGVTFGSSSCTSSGSGLGTTGSVSGKVAFVYNIVDAGPINGVSLTDGTGAGLQHISGFTPPPVPSGDNSAEIVVVPKKFVYAVFPAAHQLFAWSINSSNGALVAVSGSPYAIPSLGNVIPNFNGVNLASVAVNPAGTFLFIAYASSAQIDVYKIDTTGALTQVSGAPFSTGAFAPWNLAFDGLGKYLYSTTGSEGLGQQVAAYSISSSGALTAVSGSPFTFNMWELQGDPSGKYMIGISGRSSAFNGLADDKSLYVFNIQQSGANAGALTQVSGSPFATMFTPINLAVQPVASNGNFVYSFSGTSGGFNPIEGYQLDANSGALTAMSTSPFANIGTSPWGQFDQSGAYLFIFAVDSNNVSLGVLSVASGTGNLTEPLGPMPLASTTTYFTVTDTP